MKTAKEIKDWSFQHLSPYCNQFEVAEELEEKIKTLLNSRKMSRECKEVLKTMSEWYNCPLEFKRIIAEELDKNRPK